jgi:hypothetical protein
MSPRFFRLLSTFLAALLCACDTKIEYEEVEVGHRGPARQNPFLAAERFLSALDYDVRSTRNLRDCIKQRGTLITPLQSFNNRGEAEDVVEWMRSGGHLILILAGGENWRNDWAKFDLAEIWDIIKRRNEPEQKRLMEMLGISGVSGDWSEDESEVKIGRQKFQCRLVGKMKLAPDSQKITALAGDKNEPLLASIMLGRGRVTILAHAQPFRNRYIGALDHAPMLASLVEQGVADEIWFLNGVRISFWRMLWDRAWLGISILILLLIVWLVRYLRRFGPVTAFKAESSRDFSDHLLLTGAFLWRHKRADALIEPIQNAVRAAARKRGWHDLDDEFFKFIHSATGMYIERARAAIHSRGPEDIHSFRLLVQDLKKMLDALGA